MRVSCRLCHEARSVSSRRVALGQAPAPTTPTIASSSSQVAADSAFGKAFGFSLFRRAGASPAQAPTTSPVLPPKPPAAGAQPRIAKQTGEHGNSGGNPSGSNAGNGGGRGRPKQNLLERGEDFSRHMFSLRSPMPFDSFYSPCFAAFLLA